VSHPAGFLLWRGYFLLPYQTIKSGQNMKNKIAKDKLLQLAELLYAHLGQIDQLVEITGDSMIPVFKPGSLVALKTLLNPELLYWSEYYYIIDSNGQGLVRRVYASEIQNCITLVSDHPDQGKYPAISISWNQIKAIFKVRAEIVKH
jgi:hypothetical protein